MAKTRWMRAACPIVLLAVATAAAPAQSPAAKFVDSARVMIDRAVLARDGGGLERAAALLDRALRVFPEDPYLLHYRGYANYRRAVMTIQTSGLPAAEGYITQALEDVTQSGEQLPWPETIALQGSLTGMLIGVHPERAMELGPQVGLLMGRAAALGGRNPRVLLLEAYGAQNTPPEYGGGLERARTLAERAKVLFATDAPGPLAPSWGREETQDLLDRLSTPGAARP